MPEIPERNSFVRGAGGEDELTVRVEAQAVHLHQQGLGGRQDVQTEVRRSTRRG